MGNHRRVKQSNTSLDRVFQILMAHFYHYFDLLQSIMQNATCDSLSSHPAPLECHTKIAKMILAKIKNRTAIRYTSLVLRQAMFATEDLLPGT